MLDGEKLAVTPLGTPVMDKATAPLNPLASTEVRVMRAEVPATTVALAALAVSVKLGVNTVRLRLAVLLIPPPAAAMVTVEIPGAVVEIAAKVIVQRPLPGAAILLRENFAVTPVGRPLTDRMIAELNPAPPAVVTVTGIDPPRATLALVALSVNAKVARTVKLRG
jgi:hypothetical protein